MTATSPRYDADQNGHRPEAAGAASTAPFPAAPAVEPSGEPTLARARRRFGRDAITLALAAVLGSAVTFGAVEYADATHGTTTATTSSAAAPTPAVGATDWTTIAAKAAPSVVAIQVTGTSGGDQGSGVVWDAKGDIVTNNHVVSSQGAGAKIQVRVGAQDTYSATIVGTDPGTDLAVIRLDNPPSTLTPIQRGDSTALKVGDPVMALGNPLGLSGTVTTGIVSALDRPVTTSQVPSPSTVPMSDMMNGPSAAPVITDAIQTNAAINPGNSGGALVDSAGRLIGINSAIASLGSSGGGGQAGNIGIGFAIPVHEVTSIVDQLINTGHASVAYLGISTADATVQQGPAKISGAGIKSVASGSPAASAGLQAGDVITALNGVPLDSSTSLVGRIRGQQPNQQVTLTIHRGDQTQDVHVTLQPKPAN